MPHQWCTSASSPHCHSAHVPPFPILSKGQPEVCAGVLMGKQHSPALLPLHRHLSLHIKAHAHSPFSLTLPPSLPLCLANDSEEQKLVDGLDRGGGKGRKKKKSTQFFFFLLFLYFFFELGSQRALRAATQCTTPTCSTAGKQASEGFNGILPEAVLLRCRLFLLPLQLTPFTVSCPPSPVPLLLSPPTMHQITRFI